MDKLHQHFKDKPEVSQKHLFSQKNDWMTVSALLPFIPVLNIFSQWDYWVIPTLPKIVDAIAITGISDFVHVCIHFII